MAGHPSTAGGYTNTNRRGESFGGYSSRGSFDPSAGLIRRGSVPGNSFHLTVDNGNNNPNQNLADDSSEEFHDDDETDNLESLSHHAAIGGLRKEVVLTRLGLFPLQRSDVEKSSNNNKKIIKTPVFTMLPPQSSLIGEVGGASLYMCIGNNDERQLLVLKIETKRRAGSRSSLNPTSKGPRSVRAESRVVVTNVTETRRCKGIIDICRLTDGNIPRMLVLSETEDGHGEITLQSPWGTLIKVELPLKLVINDPFHLGPAISPSRRREGGFKRVLSEGPQQLVGLQHEVSGGQVDILDADSNRHRIHIQLKPHDFQVAKILQVCQYVLPGLDNGGDGILVDWWEVFGWLHGKSDDVVDHEWTAVWVLLFAMAVSFIPDEQAHSAVKQRKKKTGLLRSSSGAMTDLDNWDSMLDQEGGSRNALPSWLKGPSWDWTMDVENRSPTTDLKKGSSVRSTRSPITAKPSMPTMNRHNTFIIRCASWARVFLKTPAGNAAFGQSGYLPTAASKNPEIQRTALATILVGLHLLEEEAKLDIATPDISCRGSRRMTPMLAQIGAWLGWENWSWRRGEYYSVQDADIDKWVFEDCKYSTAHSCACPLLICCSCNDWPSRSKSAIRTTVCAFVLGSLSLRTPPLQLPFPPGHRQPSPRY